MTIGALFFLSIEMIDVLGLSITEEPFENTLTKSKENALNAGTMEESIHICLNGRKPVGAASDRFNLDGIITPKKGSRCSKCDVIKVASNEPCTWVSCFRHLWSAH